MATVAVFKGKEKVDLKELVEVELPKRFGGSTDNGYKWWDYIGLFCVGALMHSGGVRLTKAAFNKHAKRVGLTEDQKTKLEQLLVLDYRVEVYG